MNLELAKSLIFMDKIERERTIKGIEDFSDYVSESGTLVIFDDHVKHEIPYKKETFVLEFMNIGETAQEKAYLKGLAMKVLSKRYDMEAVAENYQRVLRFSPEKLHLIASTIYRIEEQRLTQLNGYSSTERDLLKNTALFMDIIDACIHIINEEDGDLNYIEMATDALVGMINNPETQLIDLVVNFKIAELTETLQDSDHPETEHILDMIKKSRIMNESSTVSMITLMNFIKGSKVGSSKTCDILRDEKNKLESQIDIILADYGINKDKVVIPSQVLESPKHKIIPTIISHLKEGLEPGRIESHIIGKNRFVKNIDYRDIFKLKTAYPKMQFEKFSDGDWCDCWLMTDYVDLYLILRDVVSSDLIRVQLAKNCIMTQELEVLLGCDCVPPERIRVTRIKFRESNTMNLDHVMEGINFTEDGGFKLTYKPGTSYMDDYAKINKVIVLNARNKNYDAMKSDLVFLFAFINELETILQRKEKLKDSVREDAMKARAFAKGDFKQFLAIVQTTDPQFNFSKYFDENYVNNGKVLVEFTNAEVKGFKKLLRTILG